jgi:polyphosphate glucokinase
VIVGGGASRKADKWLPDFDVDAKVVPAALENEAGIVGAALLANVPDEAPPQRKPVRRRVSSAR